MMERIRLAFKGLLDRIELLSRREKVYLLVMLVAVIGGGWYQFSWMALEKRQKEIHERIAKSQGDLTGLIALQTEVLARRGVNPDRDNQEQQQAISREIGELEVKLGKGMETLVPTEEMPHLLEHLLNPQSGIGIINLEALPAQSLLEKGKEGDGEEVAELFRHDIVIEVDGGYSQVLAYLKEIEVLPWRIFWDSLEYAVEKYPKAYVTLRIHTLSGSKAMIGD
ncbi:MAG: hypothetical protein HQL57_09795 [Magnetococcales bacterium]|nr:hypothetical protein [Magnetococcales bacterium]MBF0157463.1 hypothetical protein [Magnetococcales bacterium]